MNSLLVRPQSPAEDGTVLDITPVSAGWKYVGFKVVELSAGFSFEGLESGREVCVVIVSGSADVSAGDQTWDNLGGRSSPFEDEAPGAVYVSAGTPFSVNALTDVQIAICSAPGTGETRSRVILSENMSRETRGEGSNTRYIRNILPETELAESLLVVEVITPGGNWSSYPPHKHDTATPEEETALEETYYHRIKPEQGFSVQRVYTDDRSIDQTISVEDGDVVMVPKGYHPVGAPHGYDNYYLNVMAGPDRKWIFRNDPAHEWIVKK
ncbi:MAG: 5-deoxy-glucuronate isomerase [Hyphomonas sp.]|nr:5-deoxy-glucuronate isomerase [Hyphomonas sp.]